MAIQKINITSTSDRTALSDDIILRENESHRLLFRPYIVDNSKNEDASIKGWFVYQRKNKDGSWQDFVDNAFYGNKLKSGEGIKLELKSEEILNLLNHIQVLKEIYGEHGIQYGTQKYLVADENLVSTLESIADIKNEKILEALKNLSEEQISIFLQNLNLTNLEKVISQWDSNYLLKGSDERYWQNLLKDNSWILSQIFASPHIILGDESYYGGKKTNDKGGVYGDFLSKNSLTNSAAFIEIKTPNTKLVGKQYRGNDDNDENTIFSISEDITGAINQLNNQRATFMKNQNELKQTEINTFNCKAILVAGDMSKLTQGQKKSLELYRNSLSNIEFITFDEIREKIQYLIDIYKSEENEEVLPF